jgi:hypothetical protein
MNQLLFVADLEFSRKKGGGVLFGKTDPLSIE